MELEKIYEYYRNSSGICTDTRKIEENCMYVALKGANFDGNKFVEDALKKGARYAITDDLEVANAYAGGEVVLVEDSLDALQKLARYHRDRIKATVVGITGSNGKTTTKELCHAVLGAKFNCYATKGNLNNHIGVPLSILEIEEEHEIAIIEMGANHPGEIRELCKIANPEIGIITNIGKAHLEGFGSFEGVISTKNELYDHIKSRQGRIVYNMDSDILTELTCHFFGRYGFSRKDSKANVHYKLLSNEEVAAIQVGDYEVHSKLFGEYNAENIACAFALGSLLGVEPTLIRDAVESYRPGNNRSQMETTISGNQLILDAYNANPSSMGHAILHFFRTSSKLEKIMILGDMLELGDYSAEEHRTILDTLIANKADFDKCYLVGTEFFSVRIQDEQLAYYKDVDTLKIELKEKKLAPSFVLFKGSRGIRLENLIDLF